MRVATWNVNSLNVRLPRVDEWLGYTAPDVLLLQETKMSDERFPHSHFEAAGYQTVHHGQGQWNGVAILSKVGIASEVGGFADGEAPDKDARIVTVRCGDLTVVSVYVPNGRVPQDDHYQYKLQWFGRLRAHLAAVADPSDAVLVGGDFNVCPDDRDVWNPEFDQPRTHTSEPEREALAQVCNWGLVDLFRQHYDQAGLFSWWDYRDGAFYKRMGMRIDLLLGSETVARASRFCLVDRNARKGTKPSDHTPVLVDLEL